MLFNSPVYIFLFLPVAIIVYFALNRQRLVTAGKTWLVLASLFFYGYWNPIYLGLICGSMLVNFGIGTALHRTRAGRQPDRHAGLSRKAIIVAGVVFNLGLLGWFKYADFFIANIDAVTGAQLPLLHLALPLAISFFTFQQIAYLVDCYKSDTQEYDFLSYCLFVTFFPQLIAGPIVHHREMMPQFMKVRNKLINWRNFTMGLFIFTVGLGKKVLIADSFALWANAGFDASLAPGFFSAWGASLSYTFQLYYDFSGYSDMAIGAALMFNIRLPVNFNSPYKALSIQDFWRRWHMTLSRWLRDYLYIPLGGNRKGNVRTYINLLLTFLLGGLWHGAGWTFILWGAMHGAALAVHRLWHAAGGRMPVVLAWLTTFMFINITWVFFRATTLDDAVRMLQGMAGLNGFEMSGVMVQYIEPVLSWLPLAIPASYSAGIIPLQALVFIVLFGAVAFVAPNSVQMIRFVSYDGRFVFRTGIVTGLVTGVVAAVAVTWMLMTEGSEFLYFNF